ncbi:Hypothetical protein A7982_00054 [Minicystis rosea]|nr:Hypothetical protein A7982_00054 [Minicystis rosea]
MDVTIVDGNATGITDAVVKYSVDGGPQKDCERFVAEGSVYSCGTEEAGHFVITASHAGATQTKELDVESDECHVIGVDLTLTFP